MILTKVIDYLFIGTRFGSWGLGVLGIAVSIILGFANIRMGFGAVLLCVAALLLSVALSLLLAPQKLAEKIVNTNTKYIAVAVCLVGSAIITGLIYFTNSGFPALNLLFI